MQTLGPGIRRHKEDGCLLIAGRLCENICAAERHDPLVSVIVVWKMDGDGAYNASLGIPQNESTNTFMDPQNQAHTLPTNNEDGWNDAPEFSLKEFQLYDLMTQRVLGKQHHHSCVICSIPMLT